jgi:hypothetical protein
LEPRVGRRRRRREAERDESVGEVVAHEGGGSMEDLGRVFPRRKEIESSGEVVSAVVMGCGDDRWRAFSCDE